MEVLDMKIIDNKVWMANLQDQKFFVDSFNYDKNEDEEEEFKIDEW